MVVIVIVVVVVRESAPGDPRGILARPWEADALRFLVTWITLAIFWILLSGHWDAIHLGMGFLSVTVVALISNRHLAADSDVGTELARLLRLIPYAPWLLWEIVVANVDVLLRVLGFRPIDPRVIRFEPEMESEFGRVVLANSITLTPGTVTVEVEEDGAFVVHALAPEFARGVLEGRMTAQVKKVEGTAS